MDVGRPYHHGNLRAALLDAGVELARRGGPGSLALRDLARAAGVSASAVYRHFPDADHLVAEVAGRARRELAAAMIAGRNAIPPSTPAASRARFEAIGEAYIRFAIREAPLFETAFMLVEAVPSEPEVPSAWQVLTDGLDELVAAGLLAPPRRDEAPLVAWGAVHGVASILARRVLPLDMDADEAIRLTLAAVAAGLGLAQT